MQKLQCELCGSVDIVRTDDGFFRCEHCGCKYTLEQAKAMLGTVETTSARRSATAFWRTRRLSSTSGNSPRRKRPIPK